MPTYARRYLNLAKQTKSDSMYKLSGRYETRLNDLMEIYVGTMKIGKEEKEMIITGYGLLLKLRYAKDPGERINIINSIKPFREDGIDPILEELKTLRLINEDFSLTDNGEKAVEEAIEENEKVAFEELRRYTEAMATC